MTNDMSEKVKSKSNFSSKDKLQLIKKSGSLANDTCPVI